MEYANLEKAVYNLQVYHHTSEKYMHNVCCREGRPVYHLLLSTIVDVVSEHWVFHR